MDPVQPPELGQAQAVDVAQPQQRPVAVGQGGEGRGQRRAELGPVERLEVAQLGVDVGADPLVEQVVGGRPRAAPQVERDPQRGDADPGPQRAAPAVVVEADPVAVADQEPDPQRLPDLVGEPGGGIDRAGGGVGLGGQPRLELAERGRVTEPGGPRQVQVAQVRGQRAARPLRGDVGLPARLVVHAPDDIRARAGLIASAAMAEPPSGERPPRPPPPLPVVGRRVEGLPPVPPVPAHGSPHAPPSVPHAPPSVPHAPPPVPHAPRRPMPRLIDVGPRPEPPSADDPESGEHTSRVDLGAGPTLDGVVELLGAEAGVAVTAAGDADPRLADLNLRLALIAADVLDDRDDAVRYLELADRHPLAARLLAAHGVADGAVLDAALRSASGMLVGRERAVVVRDVIEAWLYAHAAPARALAVTDLDGETTEARGLLGLAHAVTGAWRDAATRLGALGPGALAEQVADAVAIHLDRLDDPAAALDLARRFLARRERAAEPAVHALRLVDLALEAAARVEPPAQVGLLERRLALLDDDRTASREAAATRHALGLARHAAGDVAGALATLAIDGDGGFGPTASRLAQARIAAEARRAADAIAARRALAESGAAGSLAAAHAWRALELADAHGLTPAPELHALAGGAPLVSERRALLADDPAELVAHLVAQVERGHGPARRRAALVLEARGGDPARARRVAGDEVELDHRLRLARRVRDQAGLAELYRGAGQAALATATTDDARRVGAGFAFAAGMIDLARERTVEAEAALTDAARAAPQDPGARVGLAAVFRRGARWRELATTLTELAAVVADDGVKAAVLRELARVHGEQLDEPARARDLLEQAMALRASDPGALHELARLCDQVADWPRAIELRQRAAAATDDRRLQAELFLEIGRIEDEQRKDEAAALAAFARAAAVDERNTEALRAEAVVHRRARRTDRLMSTLEQELVRGVEPSRRLGTQLELARLREEHGDVDGALASTLDALTIEADQPAALAALERVARAHGRWVELAAGLRRATPTGPVLRALGDALEQQGAWAELAAVRQAELDRASPAEQPRLAAALARLLEDKLGDVDGALRYRELAGTAADSTELLRLLERAERWPELAVALERDLAAVPPGDVDAQIAILLRLGQLRAGKLARPADAALAFEAVLERQAPHVPALEALDDLYQRLGRDKDLLRVIEARADATLDKRERSQLLARVAQLLQAKGDVDGAIAAYLAGFDADPANRDIFTSLEKLCYHHERWAAAMNLYQTAIDLVERGASRAYRLGDLYARRGQVQLQYLGEPAEAARSYEKVVELDPDNDTSVKFLESIFSQRSDWNGLIHVYEKRAGLANDDERRIDTLRRAARVAGGKLRDLAAAARLYQQILDLDPTDVESLDALERWYEREADWARLVEVLRHRLASAPAGDAATALLQRIAQICEDGLRDEARAVDAYRRILDIAPANKDALEALGRIYESTEQWADFVDVTRRQIRITTDRNLKALLYFKCGSVMEAKFGKEEDAIRYYDAAIKTSPSCLPAVHGMRDLYRRREDWPRVIETLELEVKLWQDDKERAGVFAQIGRLYEQRLGQPERALELYQAALAVDPECLPANQSLFEHYFDASDWKRAAPLAAALAVKAMRDGDPTTRSEFYRRRGLVALHTGDAKAAAESLIVALEIRPVHLEALDALIDLHRTHPAAWDFEAVYRELEKLYRKRDDAGRFLARVRVAQAGSRAAGGDLDQAAELYGEAVALAPDDFGVLSAHVDFHLSMRHDTLAVTAIAGFLGTSPPPPLAIRVLALMRQAEIHADHEMQPARAIAVLGDVIRLAPDHEEAYYRLAQEHFVAGQHAEARAAIDQVIELAAAPGSAISPESLARYYYYRGRIIEAGGDPRGATSQYRRAVDYDPGYAPPALALARRAADAGDLGAAETMLIDAAHAAMEKGGPRAAVAAQRGLARIYLAAGNRTAAIEAYRGILGVDDSPPDRVALAEIYAVEDPGKAVSELRKVLDHDIHEAPAYRLLAQSYARLGEPERAARALIAMDQLGFAADADRTAATRMRASSPTRPARRGLDEELRNRLLATAATRDVFGEILAAAPVELANLYPPPLMGESAVPVAALGDESLTQAVAEIARLAGIEVEVFVGERVPGLVALVAAPRRLVVIDRALVAEPDGPRRYLLGWAFEAIRGGYAFLHHLGRKQRAELGNFLRTLLLPESERPGPTNELVKGLPRRAAKVLERHAGAGRDVDAEAWIDGMLAMAKRGGLLACDDLAAATWMIARLSGEMLLSHDATIALGAVLGGADLIRFYLSDDYHHLREHLAADGA